MSGVGKVFLVGAGCGSHDLITLRGLNLVKSCDTLVYDSLIDPILTDFAPAQAEKISVGKRCGQHSESQQNINKILVEKALSGKTVVRLKGGDPFVFGRGGEEILALKEHNIPYSIVPGVTSCVAVPELSGIPVTHRKTSRSFHVITGHTAEDMLPEKLSEYARLNGTLVFLMGLKNLKKIATALMEGGMSGETPTAVISKGATANQKAVRAPLWKIADEAEKQRIEAPAVIVVGETAGLDLSPTIKLPLEGASVGVTGTKKLAEKLTARLTALGASVYVVGSLEISEFPSSEQLDRALTGISQYSWIVLTSMNGAEIFFKRLNQLKIDIRRLADVKFAVIGSGTAGALNSRGIFPELVPNVFTAEQLGKSLGATVKPNEKILILRAKQGSPLLTQELDKAGADYEDIKTYDVVPKSSDESGSLVKTDFITFASASGVDGFFENGCKISHSTKIICIGEITAQALSRHGISRCSICETCSTDGIINKILEANENEKIQTASCKP